MTCKLNPSEKASRAYLRYIRRIVDQMLQKEVYPDSVSLENGTAEMTLEPWGGKEILFTGMRKISFTYHQPTLIKAKKKK